MPPSPLPSVQEVRAAADAGDADGLRRCLEAAVEARQRQRSGSGGDGAGGDDDGVVAALPVLEAVADAMARSDDALDTIVDALWFESHCCSPPRGGAADGSDAAAAGKNQSAAVATADGSEGQEGSGTTPVVVELLKILHKKHSEKENGESIREKLLRNVNATVLEQSGWCSEKDLLKRVRMFNTSAYYKQHKFNLLAEESQGYAKYLHLLLSPPEHLNGDGQGRVQKQIETLIGTFSLDPNRCVDLAIDVMIQQIQQQPKGRAGAGDDSIFWAVFRALPLEHLPELLALSLQRNGSIQKKSTTRTGLLLKLMVRLVGKDLLQVDQMLDYLFPAETEALLSSAYDATIKANREQVRDMGKMKLTSTPSSTSGEEKKDTAISKAEELQKQLAESLFARWVKQLVQDSSIWVQKVQPSLAATQWSQLCLLFPEKIGAPICDAVAGLIQRDYYDSLPSSAICVPWRENETCTPSDQIGDDMTAETLATCDGGNGTASQSLELLDGLISKIDDTLACTIESGCISLRPVLYTQLCRLASYHMGTKREQQQQGKSPGPSTRVLNFIKTFLLPSLSLFPANPTLCQEVWSCLRLLPYQTRYEFYNHWRGGGLERAALRTTKPLWLVGGEIVAGKDARYALKRLSKDTIRDMSRAIAKVCHSHPLVVFTTILSQIESYDNLVQVMVDAMRYVTPLSLDVLSSCILSRLSGEGGASMVNRSRLKEDGVNVSQWLQSLEAFVGAFYKRFPDIDFRGILIYLMHQLKEGRVMELGVLQTLLKTSAGWAFQDYSPAASLSAAQLEGRAGSTMLKRETMSFGVVEDIDWRASNEVRRALQQDNMGVSLLILLAQVRHQIVFASASPSQRRPVKLVANLVDKCVSCMSILLDFLTDPAADTISDEQSRRTKTIGVYARSLPSMEALFSTYRVDVASTWMLCRPLIRAAAENPIERSTEDGDPLEAFKSSETSHALFRKMLPDPTWSYISTELFEVFYSYTLYDIHCPVELYTMEISRLDKLSQQRNVNTPPPPSSVQPGSSAPTKFEEEEETRRLKRVTARLSADLEKQKKHVVSVRELIASNKEKYFQSDQASRQAASVFLSRCIYPRCMQSPDDAMYCANFISLLHQEETPGFGTLHLLDSLIVALSRALFGLTEGEAANVSILLRGIWQTVSKWRYNESSYKEEVMGKPGSFMAIVLSSDTENDGTLSAVSYNGYQDLYVKWHAAIGAAALGALKSPEYIHTRNCLIILTRMVEVFPTRPGLANRLLKTLEPLQDESNSLADIRASAQAYSTQLIQARNDGVWKEETAAAILARQKKEKAAAVARQKQAEKQMEEIKRESEKITEEIGEWDGRRDRDRGRRDMGPPPPGGPQRGRGGSSFDRPHAAPPPPPDRRTVHPRDAPPSRDDRWVRDRAPVAQGSTASGTYSSMGSSGAGVAGSGQARGRETPSDRWQGAGSKRSRPTSPAEEGEDFPRDRPAKRSRPDPEPPARYDDGTGRRRRGGRR